MANPKQSSDTAQQGIGTKVTGLRTKDGSASPGLEKNNPSGQPNTTEQNRNRKS